MKCPKCKETELTRKGTSMSPEKHTRPLFCPKCGGVWVDNNNLEKIADFSSVDAGDVDASKIEPGHDSVTGLCPNGHGIMIRAKVHLDPPFYLEKCPACGGIWFDYGELNRIIESNLNENLTVMWTLAWQKMQKEEKGREYLHELNKELLGEEIYDAVLELAKKLKDHPQQLRALALLNQEM